MQVGVFITSGVLHSLLLLYFSPSTTHRQYLIKHTTTTIRHVHWHVTPIGVRLVSPPSLLLWRTWPSPRYAMPRHSWSHPDNTTTLQPSLLPLQMLLQLPEEQLYCHGVPALRSSWPGQPLLSHWCCRAKSHSDFKKKRKGKNTQGPQDP